MLEFKHRTYLWKEVFTITEKDKFQCTAISWKPGILTIEVDFEAYSRVCSRYAQVLESLGCTVKYKAKGSKKITASGDYLLDCLEALSILQKYVAKKPDYPTP